MKEYGMGDDATIKEIISEVDTIISEVDTDHVRLIFFVLLQISILVP